MASAFNLDELALINPARFVSDGYPHEAWTRLRREAPVCWFDQTPGEHFWAIVKHADIVFIGKRPDWKKAWVTLAPGSGEIEFFESS